MKIAVVTGASSGMGLEFAKAIDAEETLDEIWLIARRGDRLEALAKELRAPARILTLDLGRPESFEEYKKLLEAEKPLISTLCNAAGFGRFALFTETELDVNLAMIDLNDNARRHDAAEPALDEAGLAGDKSGLAFGLPAGTVPVHLRFDEGICPELFAGAERGAGAARDKGHGGVSRLGKDGIF